MKRIKIKYKGSKSVPLKWLFKSTEDPAGLICLKSRILVKGYIQLSGVDYTESFSPVETDTSTRILVGLNFFN